METYGKILLVVTPVFLILVLLEKFYGWYIGKETYSNMDMLSSLSSGITNTIKDVLGLSISIITYGWLLENTAFYTIENTLLTYTIAFLVLDFQGYWVHRIAHQINFFWNKHAIHHSSEEFNLACALRQSISSFVSLFTFFLLPAAFLGVPQSVIAIVAPLHLFAQFWYHTRHIGKMGFLEYIIVTPSHHRVHHAINPEYIDKNFAQIFIFWDRMFGTFQEELTEKPPVYGITKPVSTWNPIKINFLHLWSLMKDAWLTESWKDKLRIWFMPTGWRPADVEKKYPANKIEDVYNFQKYAPYTSTGLYAWSWIQLLFTLLIISYFFGNLKTIGTPDIFIYGAFVFLTVYSYTELMDRSRFAGLWEITKSSIGLFLIFQTGDWFGISLIFSGVQYFIAFYFVLSAFMASYFVWVEFPKEIAVENQLTVNA